MVMLPSFLAKLKGIPRTVDRSNRASILLPFLIISIGLGVLAWRSYQLSARMERGVDTLGMQYAGYAADITARRLDAAELPPQHIAKLPRDLHFANAI